jgi:hypothetical protein
MRDREGRTSDDYDPESIFSIPKALLDGRSKTVRVGEEVVVGDDAARKRPYRSAQTA